ncbi:alcohol dehydrogenase catalytic domain-containing protein [Microbacterium sp.]|uniref:alcohol dehydrogenase catalytic domain-containing protein n=1 Tax=Microbacterium sp. TaxID=51671 RepID=UPI003A8AD98A
MNAWTQHAYGGPETVMRERVPVPVAGPGQVLVAPTVVGLNSADVRLMRGEPLLVRVAFGLRRPRQPVPGRDVAGRILARGAGVTAVAVGDRVVGELDGGGLADRVVAPADRVGPSPDGVTDTTAAVLPLAGGTAWQALDLADIAAGNRVLVLGAGGGVGTLVVRLAVLRGAEAGVWGPLGRMARGALLSLGGRRRIRPLAARTRPELTAKLLELTASGQLHPPLSQTWPVTAAPAALAAIDAGGVVGKVAVVAEPA